MTSYLTNVALGAAAPMVSKDKGDISNRTKCFGAHFMNNAKMLAADTVVIGGATVAAKTALKNGKLGKALANYTDAFIKLFAKLYKKDPSAIIHKLSRVPMKSKIVYPIVLAASALVGYITHKHIYKAGQIDQKYTDKAKLEKSTKEAI